MKFAAQCVVSSLVLAGAVCQPAGAVTAEEIQWPSCAIASAPQHKFPVVSRKHKASRVAARRMPASMVLRQPGILDPVPANSIFSRPYRVVGI